MRYFLILFLLVFIPIDTVNATKVMLSHADRYGGHYNIELSLDPKVGYEVKDIFRTLKMRHKKCNIRLLGKASEETIEKLTQYYEKNIPNEFKEALASSGNLHNPKLVPLLDKFGPALKSTKLYKSIEFELNKKSFILTDITFEKFVMYESKLTFPDVHLACRPKKKQGNGSGF